MSDGDRECESVKNEEVPRNGNGAPPHRPFLLQTATTVAVRSNVCTCGYCEACQLRSFMSEQGEKLSWTRLPYSACSAVAEGERYWRLFAVTHDMGVLHQVKKAILQAEQEMCI